MAGIGEFTNLVELSKAGPTPDDPEGGYVRTWQLLDPPTWYCSITPATSRDLERISGGAFTQTATHLIRGRYHPQLAADCRIVFRGRIFEVASVHNPDEQQIELTIIATELIGVVPAAIIPQPPAAHAPTHQPGGTDPIGPQPPAIHAATHAAGGTDPILAPALPADVVVAGSVAIGTNPAQSGAIRLANNRRIMARSADNTADIPLLTLDTGDARVFGSLSVPATGINLFSADTELFRAEALNFQSASGSNTYSFDPYQFYPYGDKSLGLNTQRWTMGFFKTGLNLKETTAPGAYPDTATLFVQDNGAGKSQLMVQFATGAPIALATQV